MYRKIKVASVQMKFALVKDEQSFINKVELFVKEAKNNGCELIAFPEDCGTCLLGLWKHPISLIKSYFSPGESILNLFKRLVGSAVVPKNIFALFGPCAKNIFERTFSYLARKYNIYIMAGTILLPENRGVYNIAYLYNKEGNVIGTQKKIHLYPTEIFWGISSGDDINIFDVDFFKVGISICMDTGYPEMGRIQRLKGADLVIDATANPDYYFEYASLHGLWARVQENLFYGIHSVLVGDILGKLIFRGRAKILAPCYLTEDKTGFISVSKSDDEEDLVVGEFDFSMLYKFREEFDNIEIIKTNLLKKYLYLYDSIPTKKRKANWFTALRGLTLKREKT